ncbi:acylphosphatase [PVC group bacterium]|nr:acylphosphatase [PVC group bacterium]
MKIRGHFVVTGMVQGVFFRASTREEAQKLGLTGWVRNCQDGTVEVLAEGAEDDVRELSDWCRHGPSYAQVTDLKTEFANATDEYDSFRLIF